MDISLRQDFPNFLIKSCKSEGISKFTVRCPLGPPIFLHRVNTSGVKIRPLLKKNYDIYLLLIIFAKHSIVDVSQGFEYIPGSEYALILNIPVF